MFETLKIVEDYPVLVYLNERSVSFTKLMKLVSYQDSYPRILDKIMNLSPNPNVLVLGDCYQGEYIELNLKHPTKLY